MPTTPEPLREPLDELECLRLLATVDIGRLSFTADALPEIVPVPFAVHDGDVLVPARRSDRLSRAVRGAVVALGVDSYREVGGSGWSVTVVGASRLLCDPRAVERIEGMQLFPRSPGRPQDPERCFIAVQAALVRGWRAGGQGPPQDGVPQDGVPQDRVTQDRVARPAGDAATVDG